jgi:hypothetical protein
LLARANHADVKRQLVEELAADRRRLRQAGALSWLGAALEEALADVATRRETSHLSLAELDDQLAKLEREEAAYRARVDRIAERADGRLELMSEHLDSELQALRLRIEAQLMELVAGVEPKEARKQMPFYLESLIKGFLEWQETALQTDLAALYAEVDRDLSEAAASSLRAIDLRPGYLPAALRLRPAKYDPATQASRILGITGIGLLAVGELPLAAIALVASQALRLLTRGRREAAERAQVVEAGQRAMRACVDRARQALSQQMQDYRSTAVEAIRADGSARMQQVIDALARAREARRAGETERDRLPAEACDAELDRLVRRVRALADALSGEASKT